MRKNSKRIDSSVVQGEGSYIVVSLLTYGESKAARGVSDVSEEERLAFGERLISGHILEWNWTDEYGTALPVPAADPHVLEGMPIDEMNFLMGAVTGSDPNGRSG
ncbi:MAG: hypothetical protein L6Q98_19900 [Anaerolineae bacterium]|nr:hypothetical protein [Anaerolineae bacterium]NUQ06723.1 hypothetical protein [Anaerolineae bacterium]